MVVTIKVKIGLKSFNSLNGIMHPPMCKCAYEKQSMNLFGLIASRKPTGSFKKLNKVMPVHFDYSTLYIPHN